MTILFLGDIFGRPGRRLVRELLPSLVCRHQVDLVVANAENASGGLGLTVKAAEELFKYGINVLTSGNHIFRHKEIYEYLDNQERLLRPANYPDPCPGQGSVLVPTASGVKVGVVNVMGRIFMEPLDCPFEAAARESGRLKEAGAEIVVVDLHAEATSEKKAMGWHLDGRVGAVLGTHTHVQTADEEILPGGTAYVTDLGMTGPHRSVIGMKKEAVLEKFLSALPARFEVAKRGLRLEGALVWLELRTGLAEKIERIQQVFSDEKK
ncbi:MAG: TIGR00282 family metallophosphoesterase [Pseudomonadota bacterium]